MRAEAGTDRERGGPPRLHFLDGLRGLAALYVVLHHAALFIPPNGLSGPSSLARYVLRHGHYAVPVFITLSGYGLMTRAVASPGGGLPGGFRTYIGRRARRILPAYYGALALCWLLTAAVPALGRPAGTPWDRALPAFSPGVVVSHLLLVHNLDPGSIYRVSPPLWSLATEWQIYLLFPALLAVWRRRGAAATVAAGFAVGSSVCLLSIPMANPALRDLCPWYVGLFALGMAGAAGPGPRTRTGAVAGLASLALAGFAAARTGLGYLMLTDALTGAATAGLLVRCARASRRGDRSPGLRLLESRWAVGLGASSYSLYLIHYPLLGASNLWLRDLGLGPGSRLLALIAVATPGCVLASSLFARGFEPPPTLTARKTPFVHTRHRPRPIPRPDAPIASNHGPHV